MSLEYAIEYPCQMRRQYDEATLRAVARTGSLISRIVNQTLEGSHLPSEESINFTTRFSDDLEKAELIALYCRTHCPAHLDRAFEDDIGDRELSGGPGGPEGSVGPGGPGGPGGHMGWMDGTEPIGCLGRIRYPIEARFERFLADRLQLIYDIVAPENWPHLLHILIDSESPFDGEGTKELRRVTTPEGMRFFEQRVPIELARRAGRLTTNNIFDLLAGFTASDGGASGYQRELPVNALPDYGEFLEALLINDLTEDERVRLNTQSASYAQYVRFTRGVRLAQRLGVRILMD